MEKYKDFGDMVKKISKEENPDVAILYYIMKELEKIGIAIEKGELSESDVKLVLDDTGISLEILKCCVEKFFIKLTQET